MPLALLANWKVIVGGVLLAIILTLWTINRSQANTIEEQAFNLATVEAQLQIKEMENLRLNDAIKRQNEMIVELAKEGKKLQDKVDSQAILIASLQQIGDEEIEEIENQEIPNTPEGALRWMLEKALSELR